MRPLRFALFGLTFLLTACAAGGGASGEGQTRRDPYVITAEDLVPHQGATAYEAIRRLRANWLTRRGGRTPVVFVNGAQQGMGGFETLQEFRVMTIERMEFISATDATMRWGTGYSAGVINIVTK
jgi:hypothetical protein